MSDTLRSQANKSPASADDYAANAELAKQEIAELAKDPIMHSQLVAFAKVWKFWYLVCGHKHLGRILLEFAKQ